MLFLKGCLNSWARVCTTAPGLPLSISMWMILQARVWCLTFPRSKVSISEISVHWQTLLSKVSPNRRWRTPSDGARFWFPQSVTNQQMRSAASSGAAEPTGSADEIVKNNPPQILVAQLLSQFIQRPSSWQSRWVSPQQRCLHECVYLSMWASAQWGSNGGKRITAQPRLPPHKHVYISIGSGVVFT